MAADLYEYAAERLASLGIERYEISNFARPGFESRHNLKYWRRERYVGFGADAHSFDGEARRGNAESLEDFVRSQGGTAEAANAAEEKFFLGLRLREGVPLAAEDWARFEAPIRRFAGEGLLEINGENLRLTPRGILLSNEVFQEFLL
jgi:oxygen-independent coproporphyrinogen-3 oxidase